MSNQEEIKNNWPISVTVALFLGFAVAVVWFILKRDFESLSNLLIIIIGEAGIVGFFAFRRSKVQKEADVVLATVMLIVVPIFTIMAYSYETAPPQDSPAVQTLIAHLGSIDGTLTAIPQTVAALEGQGSAPTATALANQQTELESTRNAIPTVSAESAIPAARLTLTPLVAKINSTVSAVSANKVALTNPTSGQFVHDQDELLEYFYSPVSVRNFETQVKFFNPYDATFRKFDFGILFRVSFVGDSDNCLCYRLQVNSDGNWQLLLITKVDPFDYDVVYSDKMDASFINTGENESNNLRLVVYEEDAYFYLNGNYIGKINVSDRMNAGGVSIAIGMKDSREFVGNVTRYEDFTVWQILDE